VSSKEGYSPLIKPLIKENLVNSNEILYAFYSAVENDYLDLVKYLISKGADIHADNDSALTCIALGGHLDIVKYLIEGPEDWGTIGAPDHKNRECPWNTTDIHSNNDDTLHYAALSNLCMVKYLIKHGANIHGVLVNAVLRNKLDTVKYLVRHGGNVCRISDKDLDNFQKRGFLDFYNYLIEER
jgi:ankyrin repeat protein